LIFTQASLLYFAVVFLIERAALAAGLGVVYVGRKLSIFEWRPRLETAVGLLKDSWPLVLSGIAVSIYMKIDQVMIKQILDAKAVGQYAAAVKISEAWYFVPVIVCGSLFPAVINAKKQSEEQYNARLQKLYSLMVWVALPITVVITFSAGGIIRLLYGTEFSEAASVLTVHIWAGVFVFLGVASSKWFLAENLQLYSFLYKGSGAVINVILNFFFIKRFGVVGAAWATVISYGFAAYFLNFIFAKTRSNFYLMCQSFNILRIVRLLGR
jgi:O-antigen/teichoic acid export membrane protein